MVIKNRLRFMSIFATMAMLVVSIFTYNGVKEVKAADTNYTYTFISNVFATTVSANQTKSLSDKNWTVVESVNYVGMKEQEDNNSDQVRNHLQS